MQTFVLLSSTTLSFAICLFVFFCFPRHIAFAQLAGSKMTCDVEKQPLNFSDVDFNMECYDCTCEKGFVECVHKCPKLEGCYFLEDLQKDECCQKCKGCTKGNVYYASGTEWTDLKHPCKVFTCLAGVITESSIQCLTFCDNPLPPKVGQCCPTCPECQVNGTKIIGEMRVMQNENPCITCKCEANSLTCMKKACPILNCPDSKKVEVYEECCPQCTGSSNYMAPPKGACLLGNTVYPNGKQFILDECSHCTCNNSTMHCERMNCPVLRCKRENQETLLGHCCAQCRDADNKELGNEVDLQENTDTDDADENAEDADDAGQNTEAEEEEINGAKSETDCVSAGIKYKNGETWDTEVCETCKCSKGSIKCNPILCPAVQCPPDSSLKVLKGQCCPTCVEGEAVCTVFGGSHFRTFDSKLYAFVGTCKYQLISDCDDGTFNIRIKLAMTSNQPAIKRVSLKLEKVKVDLQQNRNTKVNEKIVDLPYRMKNKLEIKETNEIVEVTSKLGIKVHWNYMGFLEVTVPNSYRKQLCGLCGNFNSNPEDDLTTREGILVESPAIFAQSWTTDDECLDTNEYGVRGCNPEKDQRLCNYIKGAAFQKCSKKLNVTSYYETCLRDMCQCPPNDLQCHCESFASYARDCRRLGIMLPRWRKSVGC